MPRILSLLRKAWFPAAIVFICLYSFPYFTEIHSANELPRIYLTMAMVDRRSLDIEVELRRFFDTPDTSTYKGKRYSNKPPGISLLTVPVYVFQKWANGGRTPELIRMFFWFRLFGVALPSLLFLVLLWRFLGRLVPDEAMRRMVLAAYALGTLALTYGTLLFSHQLSSALVATGFILIFFFSRGEGSPLRLLWAGLAAGAGVLTDYQVAFLGPPLFVYLVWAVGARVRRGTPAAGGGPPIANGGGGARPVPRPTYWRAMLPPALFCVGAALPLGVLLVYHWGCFESPLRTGYNFPTDPVFRLWHSQGFLGLSKFKPAALGGRYFSADDGLFWYSPFLLLALPGLVLMLRRRAAGLRAEGVLCLVAILLFVYFAASIAFVSGWDVGPRYITAVIPYYLVPVAVFATTTSAWTRVLCYGLMGVAILIYATVNAVFPHFPDNFSNPWFDVTLRFGRAGYLPYNLGWLLGLRGLASALPYLAVLGALLVALLLGGPGSWRRRALVGLASVGLAFCLLVLYHHQLSWRREPVPVRFLPWMERIWEPRHQGMDVRKLLPAGDPRTSGLRTVR